MAQEEGERRYGRGGARNVDIPKQSVAMTGHGGGLLYPVNTDLLYNIAHCALATLCWCA